MDEATVLCARSHAHVLEATPVGHVFRRVVGQAQKAAEPFEVDHVLGDLLQLLANVLICVGETQGTSPLLKHWAGSDDLNTLDLFWGLGGDARRKQARRLRLRHQEHLVLDFSHRSHAAVINLVGSEYFGGRFQPDTNPV